MNGDIRITTENTLELYINDEWRKIDPISEIKMLKRENLELKAEISTLKAMMKIN